MMLLHILLLVAFSCCSGNPLSSPRTREEMVTSSLNVTMDTLNRLSGRRNLLRLFSTGEINITPMIKARNDAFTITLQFTVKETTCKKKAIDLSRCAFKAGKETEAPCYAETLILEKNTWNSNVQCNLTSSGPDSTEMLFMVRKRTDTEKTDRDFENRWREWTKIFMEELKERKQQRENRRREEEENKIKME
ncbi:hypothetical protein GDO81_017283 [Engystomops pustulosus]|uniref:Uncharacterized protein n=1 Tax=Engystomops pustulosus TaxID=76066 RepID=A0AAV7AJJ0_ENGPU|nr:hypothetical protein GDO81_017283 [Engystomops pustulosus]